MNTSNLTQILATETLIETAVNNGIGYIPVMDSLANNRIQPNAALQKNLIRSQVNIFENKADLINLQQGNIKKGYLTPEDIKVSLQPYMLEFTESQLSGIKGLSNSTSEILSILNKQYDQNVAWELINNKKAHIASVMDGSNALNVAKRIVAMANEVSANTQNSTVGALGSSIRIVMSSDISSMLSFPTSASQASSPLEFLLKALENLGIKDVNIERNWNGEQSEVWVSNTNSVELYTYGAPKVHQSGSDSRANVDYVQFIFSSVTAYLKQDGALIYQSFNKVG